MTTYNDRRSRSDRRRITGLDIRMLLGAGSRRFIRRQEDKSRIFFVDQFSPKHFMPILVTLFFSVADALLTLFLIGHGAYEINPIMAYYQNIGPYYFFTVKYLLTSLSVIVLLIFRNHIFRIIKISASVALYLIAGMFIAVVAWQIHMISKIIG